jgi:hypothetical protein
MPHNMALLKKEDVWEPEVIGRHEFAEYYFHYKPGQHVLFAGPTQLAGKTTLAFQLLEYAATPDCPAYVAVSKPTDAVTEREGKRLGYRFVTEWPVPSRVQDMWAREKPRGYIIWPKFGDIDSDVDRAAAVTAALLRDRYAAGVRKKPGILVMDDTVVKSKLLKLDRYMTTHIAMAGAMKLGGWYFVQKPTGSGDAAIWSYGNSAHIFLSRDGDKKNRDRYDEIGGFDSHQVAEITQRLTAYQFLYLRREKAQMCIVDSK